MAKNLMIQGTMSGAGKSILTAGILRVLRQDGFRVAPFKSQNMALNSFVTRDGLEMGRAQVVQAAAAGMEPSADMNPILLKPMGDTTSQVIVNGRPVGKMRAADYYRVKRTLVPSILDAYHRLEEQADIIVIEGAGSPVEINLRKGDFVNMGLAELVDAPVLLAGNIDPGGVFAQLLGTVQLMRPEERARVKGLIINKFRGDVSLLEPGLTMFREYCDIPFAGVVPWIRLDLDEEDSMSERLAGKKRGAAGGPGSGSDAAGGPGSYSGAAGGDTERQRRLPVDIAVIRLPYISNYTDFSPLGRMDGVNLRYVRKASELGKPDLIILPGTKNTIGDLRWLRESGLSDRIPELVSGSCGRETAEADGRKLSGASCGDGPVPGASCGDGPVPEAVAAGNGPLLMGICGGYQMLGRRILDPLGSETGGCEEGLGLLPVETVFGEEKYTRQRSGRTVRLTGVWEELSDLPVSGYEIHMGKTVYPGEMQEDGVSQDGTAPGEASGTAFAELGNVESANTANSGKPVLSTDGAVCGRVLGTYLHGIFDEPVFRGALLRILRKRREEISTAAGGTEASSAANGPVTVLPRESRAGAEASAGPQMESALQMQERQLDMLAEVLRKNLDWGLIYKAIGL